MKPNKQGDSQASHASRPESPGLGPRVFVGFDAEWTKAWRGRNRIDSVQFLVIGPTGKSHEKVVDLSGDLDLDQRTRVTDALDVLLGEAEQA